MEMSSYEKISRCYNLAIAIYEMEKLCGNESNIDDIISDLVDDVHEKLHFKHEEIATLKEAIKKKFEMYNEKD